MTVAFFADSKRRTGWSRADRLRQRHSVYVGRQSNGHLVKFEIRSIVAGAVIAALILATGYARLVYAKSQMPALVEKCKADAAQNEKGPWLDYQKHPLFCSTDELSKLSRHGAVGIQKQIVSLVPEAEQEFEITVAAAIALLLAFCVPYAWQFALMRIREVANAIAGR